MKFVLMAYVPEESFIRLKIENTAGFLSCFKTGYERETASDSWPETVNKKALADSEMLQDLLPA